MLLVSTLASFLVLAVTAPLVDSAPLVDKATTQEVQMILSHHGYSLSIDGVYGRQTIKAVKHWQKVNGLFVDGVVGPVTLSSLRQSIDGPADGPLVPAKRLNPPVPQFSDPCEEMSFYRQQAGLPERFDAIGFRESRCNNTVTSRTGCCFGYWQNYLSSHLRASYRERIVNECGVTQVSDIRGDSPQQKQRQACVTKVVYDISGFSPWAL